MGRGSATGTVWLEQGRSGRCGMPAACCSSPPVLATRNASRQCRGRRLHCRRPNCSEAAPTCRCASHYNAVLVSLPSTIAMFRGIAGAILAHWHEEPTVPQLIGTPYIPSQPSQDFFIPAIAVSFLRTMLVRLFLAKQVQPTRPSPCPGTFSNNVAL